MNDGEKIQAIEHMKSTAGWKVLISEINSRLDSDFNGVIRNGVSTLRDFDIWRGQRVFLEDFEAGAEELINSLKHVPETTEEGMMNDPFSVASGTQNPDVEV